MPYKDRSKQLGFLRAWRITHAEDIRRKKHAYYLAHREEFAERKRNSKERPKAIEGPFESRLLRSSRNLARWRDVPGAARLPVRRGRRRIYLGTAGERHAQAQRVYIAKKRARGRTAAPDGVSP